MVGNEPKTEPAERAFVDCTGEDHDSVLPVDGIKTFVQNFKWDLVRKGVGRISQTIAGSGLFSTSLLLLAMPMFGVFIQIGLFLFGKTCSPYPMWISFLVFSILAALNHWKTLAKFWSLVFLALLLASYTFSDRGNDAELYHIPMQILLRDGWNPVFDSTLQKISAIVDPSKIFVYHTLFLPKTVALCGTLVAQATGLWIASSFLGYLLLFVLFRTSFVFAEKNWNCKKGSCLLFAVAVSFCPQFVTLLDGLVDYHVYSSLMITIFSLVLYLQHRRMHDFILAIAATVICSTIKSTGLINCILLWGMFWLCSWKCRETYWGILAVMLLVAWIGMSPWVTSWIQYGSPFYPLMTFDPRITPVDITDDFFSNADGERMGYLARFVYAWISPKLATKACALYYHKPDFCPDFNLQVTRSVGGFGIFLNLFFCCSLLLLLLARKNLVSFLCLFILATLVSCPVKYIGYERYFPQICAVVPLGIYQFCFSPPAWLKKKDKLKRILHCTLFFVLLLPTISSCLFIAAYQTRNMILESKRQDLLLSYRKDGIVFEIPQNTHKAFALSQRLICGNVDYSFSRQTMDMHNFKFGWHKYLHFEDDSFPQFKQYSLDTWDTMLEYEFRNNPASFLHFKWLDIFRFFPHPLFYRKADILKSPESGKTMSGDSEKKT